MAKRRGKGEGSISLRPDGRWMARCDMGRTEDGQRQRKTVYGSTRAAVATKLNEQLGKAAAGELLTSSTPTLKSWLNSWFDTFSGSAPGTIATWSTGTQRVYRCAIDEWLVPPLGATRLEKLTPFKIQKWINGATVKRASEKVVLAHCVLRSALRWAMKQRVLTYNPAALVEVPRPVRKPITPLSAEQSRTLLETAA